MVDGGTNGWMGGTVVDRLPPWQVVALLLQYVWATLWELKSIKMNRQLDLLVAYWQYRSSNHARCCIILLFMSVHWLSSQVRFMLELHKYIILAGPEIICKTTRSATFYSPSLSHSGYVDKRQQSGLNKTREVFQTFSPFCLGSILSTVLLIDHSKLKEKN